MGEVNRFALDDLTSEEEGEFFTVLGHDCSTPSAIVVDTMTAGAPLGDVRRSGAFMTGSPILGLECTHG